MDSVRTRITLAALIVCFALPGLAVGRQWNAVGVRGGVGDQNNNESFSQVEAYLNYGLPWMWELDSKWVIGSFIALNAGAIRCEENAFVGSIGPGFYFMTPSHRFVFSAGIYPTYISRSKFGEEDFGGWFQFTSSACINFNFKSNLTAGYCFQHMSNAGLYDNNPGLNTHLIGLGFRF